MYLNNYIMCYEKNKLREMHSISIKTNPLLDSVNMPKNFKIKTVIKLQVKLIKLLKNIRYVFFKYKII